MSAHLSNKGSVESDRADLDKVDFEARFLDHYPDVLLPDEVQAVLMISKYRLRDLLGSGKLKYLRINKDIRIPKKSLQEYIESCCHIYIDHSTNYLKSS